MRVLVQRVTSASVRVDGHVVGAIEPAGQGLLALVGVTHTDTAEIARRMAEKLWRIRILDQERSAAAPASLAEPLVCIFADQLRSLGADVVTGEFGAHMEVELVNDGPVTVMLEL